MSDPRVTRDDVQRAAVEAILGNPALLDMQVAIGNVFMENMDNIGSCGCKLCTDVVRVLESFPV